MSYTEVGCGPLTVLPSAGKREYDGARECPLEGLKPAACPGLEGSSMLSSKSFGEKGLLSVGEVLSESMLNARPFSAPIKLARLVARLDSAL